MKRNRLDIRRADPVILEHLKPSTTRARGRGRTDRKIEERRLSVEIDGRRFSIGEREVENLIRSSIRTIDEWVAVDLTSGVRSMEDRLDQAVSSLADSVGDAEL